jgi:hypothetical protein
MADWRTDAANAARRYGLDPNIFIRQMGQEAGGKDATSPAGAQGPAQFMPGTARSVGLTSRTVHQRVPAYNAAAKLMAGYVKQYKSYRNALVAYNAGPGNVGRSLPAETQGYLATILHGRDPGSSGVRPGGGGGGGGGTVTVPGVSEQTPMGVAQGSAGALALVQALTSQQRQPAASGALPTPATTAAPPMPQGYQAPMSGGGPTPKPDVDALLSAVQTIGQDVPALPAVAQSPALGAADSNVPAGAGSADTNARGTAAFEGKKVAAWIAPALQYARQHGWKGGVNSGWRSLGEQTRIYNSGVRPAARPGTSNHEFTGYPGGAVDVSDAAQLSAILRNSPWRKKLIWAGSKDPVHFSHPHGGSY